METTKRTTTIWFWTCPYCAYPEPKPGDVIVTSTADWPICGVCGRYALDGLENWVAWSTRARMEYEEPCNCLIVYGRIQHRNGGWFHRTTWVLEETW